MEPKVGNMVAVSQLRLGDVVEINRGTYMQATVVEQPTHDGLIGRFVLRRPYLMIDDFSHAGRYEGAAVGFGIWAEEMVFQHDSKVEVLLLFRRTAKIR